MLGGGGVWALHFRLRDETVPNRLLSILLRTAYLSNNRYKTHYNAQEHTNMDNLAESWNWFSTEVHSLAIAKGWYDNKRSVLECLGLVYSELGEAVEGFRSPRCSGKILGHSQAAEELADVIIRLADMCAHFNIEPWLHHEISDKAELFDACGRKAPEDQFAAVMNVLLAQSIHWGAAAAKNPIEQIAMVSAYLGEAVFASLYHNGLDVADSVGDAIIAVCRIAHDQQINLGEALLAKHQYNQSRSYRHGAKLY